MIFLKVAEVAVGVIAYLNIGYHLVGKVSWHVWHKRNSNSIPAFILFPFSSSTNKVGIEDDGFSVGSADEEDYLRVMAVIWPIKVAFFTFFATIFGTIGIVVAGVAYVGTALIDGVTTGPGRLINRISWWRQERRRMLRLRHTDEARRLEEISQEVEAAIEGDSLEHRFRQLEDTKDNKQPTE